MTSPGAAAEEVLAFSCEGDRLLGVLHRPAAGGRRGVLVVVGGPQYRVGSHRQFVLLARDLARNGFPVLRFDYRGMGDSDGLFRGFEAVSADIAAAVRAFRDAVPGLDEVVLWGLCDGATAAAFYAGARPGAVAGLILANPWVRTEAGLAKSYVKNYYGRRFLQPAFWTKLLTGRMNVLRAVRSFLADVRKAGATLDVAGDRGDAPLPVRMQRALAAFKAPVLLVISGKDLTAGEFVVCAGGPGWGPVLNRPGWRRLDLPDADHTFSRRAVQDRMSGDCVAWLRSW